MGDQAGEDQPLRRAPGADAAADGGAAAAAAAPEAHEARAEEAADATAAAARAGEAGDDPPGFVGTPEAEG